MRLFSKGHLRYNKLGDPMIKNGSTLATRDTTVVYSCKDTYFEMQVAKKNKLISHHSANRSIVFDARSATSAWQHLPTVLLSLYSRSTKF